MKKVSGTLSSNKEALLCKLSDLEDLSCKTFTVNIKRKPTRIFIVRKDELVFGYVNICPHAQAPLEWNPDDFLDESKENIICAMHGAKFTIEEGACVEGPCNGVGLTSVELFLDKGLIYLS